MAQQLHIVALGSSFAAGPGIPPQVNTAAKRSGKNYAHLVAERLHARLTDLTVSGATLDNVLSTEQVLLGNRFKAQLSAMPTDADIVTITAGGNDLNYIGGMTHDSLHYSIFTRLLSYLITNPATDNPVAAEDIAASFTAVIDKIREIAPKCRIFLVEYLTMFDFNTKPGIDVLLHESEIRKYQNLAEVLQAGYQLAAQGRSGCERVPVATLSQGHGLGSAEPWVEGFGFKVLMARKAPFHPNAKGMEAVADMIYHMISEK
jgi:lysophospholipase L1-like esterase